MAPKDEDELADMLYTAMLHDGPIAIRYPRGIGPGVPVKDVPARSRSARPKCCNGEHDRVAIFALGALVPMAQELAVKLEGEGISAAVINARFVKPIDRGCSRSTRAAWPRSSPLKITLEGGFGSAVLEALSNLGSSTPVVRIGWPDQFIEHGKLDALRKKYGITVEAALEKLRLVLRKKVAEAALRADRPA